MMKSEQLTRIASGIQNNSYSEVESGVIGIGEQFGLSAEEIRKDKVTRETLFNNSDDELYLF